MISIDSVYQKVLVLSNKEQRGYITPQEFNLLATHAQDDIFEQYFYDLNQFRRLPGNDSKYADMVDILEEKISIFKQGPLSLTNGDVLSGVYRLTDLNYNGKNLTEIRYEDYYKIQTPLLKPSTHRPVYWIKNGAIYFEGIPSGEAVSAHYIRKPKSPNWTYQEVGTSGVPMYDDSKSDHQNFELHASEETDLVIKILGLFGITTKDTLLYQTAVAEDTKNIQQEKL